MELNKQVASLELSKRLKELGVKQESHFYWCRLGAGDSITENVNLKAKVQGKHWHSAFTVAELGEMLPEIEGVPFGSWRTSSKTTLKLSAWCCDLVGDDDTAHLQTADTEADARAKMLIYLIENKLITV